MVMKEEIELREDRKRWRENAILNEIERLKKSKTTLDRKIRRRTVFLSSLVLFLLVCIYQLLSRETNSMAQNRNLVSADSSYRQTSDNIYALAVKKSYTETPYNFYTLPVKKNYPEMPGIRDTLPIKKIHPETLAISNKQTVNYRIQLGAFAKRMPSFESSLDTVEMKWINENGLIKYYLGNFQSLEHAKDLFLRLSQNGFPDVFIYPVKEGEKITWKEHNRIKRKQNTHLHLR